MDNTTTPLKRKPGHSKTTLIPCGQGDPCEQNAPDEKRVAMRRRRRQQKRDNHHRKQNSKGRGKKKSAGQLK